MQSHTLGKQIPTNISDEVLRPVACVNKVLTVVIVRVQTLGTLKRKNMLENKHITDGKTSV